MPIPFRASATRSSVGVEWELMLADRHSRELTQRAPAILADPRTPTEGAIPRAKAELLCNTVEVVTGVCLTVDEALADLDSTISTLHTVVKEHEVALLCSGTHPFSNWDKQSVSENPRYQELVEWAQWVVRRMAINGVHVHVGVTAQERVIPLLNALLAYIPHFVALSASSPYWKGHDTGLASSRTKIFESMPGAGLPAHHEDWEEFEQHVEVLLATGSIRDARQLWWDIRPHADFGTIEFRMCDGLATFAEVGAVAALAQCLTDRLDRALEHGYTLPVPQSWVVEENKWRTARYGLDAHILTDARGTVMPVRDAIVELVEDLMPTARRLRCTEELAQVARILTAGASYQRQRAVAVASGGDLTQVVDHLIVEMRDGLIT